MTRDCERAQELIMRRGTEELAAPDVSWLHAHLDQCAECSGFADNFAGAGRVLQAVAVTASSSLVSSTQLRLRVRAGQLRDQQNRLFLIALSFCIGVLASAASGLLWWRVGGWVVARLGLPEAIVVPGAFLLWLLPAVLVAVLMLAYPHSLLEGSLLQALVREQEGEKR